jgi:hypothetical protein
MAEAKAKQDPATSSTRGAKAPEEPDPAKQTPDGQKRREGQPKMSTTADSAKSKSKSSTKGKSDVSSSSKTSVQVSLDQVQSDVLDNLRAASSRHDYLQAIVNRHLEAANPVATFQEDDDLPGNEREVRNPNFRV